MTSRTHRHFWTNFNRLPEQVQASARKSTGFGKGTPFTHRCNSSHCSVMSGQYESDRHRALARRSDDLVVWFWIGAHEEYNNLLQRLR